MLLDGCGCFNHVLRMRAKHTGACVQCGYDALQIYMTESGFEPNTFLLGDSCLTVTQAGEPDNLMSLVQFCLGTMEKRIQILKFFATNFATQ